MTSNNQRAELQNQIWKIANDVRGSIRANALNFYKI